MFSVCFFPFQWQPILESGAVELLCGLTQSENPALRVNGIWALMVCFTLLCMSSLTKRIELFAKVKLKHVLFETSGFFLNLAILAQLSNHLGPRGLHIQLSDSNISNLLGHCGPLFSYLLLREVDRCLNLTYLVLENKFSSS